jgi:hypothetical protein
LRHVQQEKAKTMTKFRALLMSAAIGAAALAATAASAAPTVTVIDVPDHVTLPVGQTLVADFDDLAQGPNAGVNYPDVAAGFTLTLDGATAGFNEGGSGYSGTLPNDPTHYLTIPGGSSATLTSTSFLSSFSLYMGSPDTYNSIRFLGLGGYDFTLVGGDLSAGNTSQSWDYGKRVNFDFGGANVNQIVLTSSGNSFETDSWAAGVGAVPEPATWAMMIIGFASVGAALRRRTAQTAVA